jgi:hypothetical protein
MSNRRYLKPPWMQRHVGNRLAPLFRPSLISKLSVERRRSGGVQTVPLAVLDYEGDRYLVSYRGESDWARNLRATRRGRLKQQGRSEEISVEEVPIGERPALLQEYSARFGKLPTVGKVLSELPDPADHPTFRITATGRSR